MTAVSTCSTFPSAHATATKDLTIFFSFGVIRSSIEQPAQICEAIHGLFSGQLATGHRTSRSDHLGWARPARRDPRKASRAVQHQRRGKLGHGELALHPAV